jgi:hypothetical protein
VAVNDSIKVSPLVFLFVTTGNIMKRPVYVSAKCVMCAVIHNIFQAVREVQRPNVC